MDASKGTGSVGQWYTWDDTFLTGRFRGCLIAATGFFPLAVTLVDSETVNNWECTLAEALNNWVLVLKKMLASDLLDQIRRKIMVMSREIGASMMTPLTPKSEEKLEALEYEGLAWEVLVASPTVFEVFSERCVNSSYTRHMDMWCVYSFPYDHALAAIRKIKCEAVDFISPYFTSNYFRKTYLHVIQPIPNYNRPIEIKEDNIINPPIVKKQPGRPPGKWILSKGEKKVNRKVHCSNCKEVGHNRESWKNPPKYTPLA
ncbi:uncharacterized protein LOC113350788 [Papaver somniferum]|uniref:uncharacterized protein LOC113350788 n=1 Tax=Papaver somniferum TaxID=3469 RepID=UPI000E6FB7D6|nr:uncharacterized protein LOC113350788 [Papaver somniferum]